VLLRIDPSNGRAVEMQRLMVDFDLSEHQSRRSDDDF